MRQQKWFSLDKINVGDVILFNKNNSVIAHSYTYGIIKELEYGKYGKPHKAIVRYCNPNENVLRETYRAVCSLIVIHHVDDCDLMKEHGEMDLHIDLTP